LLLRWGGHANEAWQGKDKSNAQVIFTQFLSINEAVDAIGFDEGMK
jgi:hypothetical protein